MRKKDKKRFVDTKGAKILGGIAKMVISKVVPGGQILTNIASDNGAVAGSLDKEKAWPDVAIELGKIVLWILALKYLGIDIIPFLSA